MTDPAEPFTRRTFLRLAAGAAVTAAVAGCGSAAVLPIIEAEIDARLSTIPAPPS